MPKTIDTIVPKSVISKTQPVKPAVTADAIPPPTTATSVIPAEPVKEVAADSYASLFPEPTVSISSPPTWIWWVLLVIAAVGLGLLGFYVANGKVNQWLTVPQASPAAKAAATYTASPVPTSSPSASAALTSTPTPTPNPSPSANPVPITIKVLNGTKKAGAASSVASTLQKAGYKVISTGNAASQSYTSTTIYYGNNKLSEAQAVQKFLTQYSSSLKEDATIVGSTDLVVVLGPTS